jgi:hypothetical protein
VSDEFEWPCDRRDAHGEHEVGVRQRVAEGMSAAHTERITLICPGVLAHPATMIGGNYKEER